MAQQPASDEIARQLRAAWFTYVDTIEPVRRALCRYCRRLTRVWEADDLLRETLLRWFGAIGRGDLHGDTSRVKDTRAYLFRIATNLWIDQLRRNEVRSDSIACIREYAYCPDAIDEVAAELSVKAAPRKCHQDPAKLADMIATSNLPWTRRSEMSPARWSAHSV